LFNGIEVCAPTKTNRQYILRNIIGDIYLHNSEITWCTTDHNDGVIKTVDVNHVAAAYSANGRHSATDYIADKI